MKLYEFGLAVVVGVSSFTATSSGIQVYADYEEKENSLAQLQKVEFNFDEEKFELSYEDGKKFDSLFALAADENGYTESASADADVDLSKLGEQTVTYTLTATDSFQQSVTKTVEKTFTVSDVEAPVVSFKHKKVTLTEGDAFDANENIKAVTDNYDGDLLENSDQVTVSSNVEDKPGTYEVTVKASDTSGNETEKSYTVVVEAKPVVVSTPVYTQASYSTSSYSSQNTAVAASTASAPASSSASAPAAQQAAAPVYVPPMGTAGRIYLSNGYSAALNSGSLWDAGTTQAIINNGDSAFVDYSFNYIADHAAQGFRFDYGSQLTWVYADGSSRTFTCTRVLYGAKGTWTCSEGFDVLDGAGGQLITQTCDGNSLRWGYWN